MCLHVLFKSYQNVYLNIYIYNLAYICNLSLWITIEWVIFCDYQNESTNTADFWIWNIPRYQDSCICIYFFYSFSRQLKVVFTTFTCSWLVCTFYLVESKIWSNSLCLFFRMILSNHSFHIINMSSETCMTLQALCLDIV